MINKHQLAAKQAGGTLVCADLSVKLGQNGGCGAPTYVEGTNGGQIPCGSILHQFGEAKPYYCAACQKDRE